MLKLDQNRIFQTALATYQSHYEKIISRIRIEFDPDKSPESTEKLVSTSYESRMKKLLPNLGLTLVFLEPPDDFTKIYFLIAAVQQLVLGLKKLPMILEFNEQTMYLQKDHIFFNDLKFTFNISFQKFHLAFL